MKSKEPMPIVDEINLKTIPGFPNYAITKDGRVWSKPRKDSMGRKQGGSYLSIQKQNGYYHIPLYQDRVIKRKKVHRLVLETFVGPCPEGMECRHLDGNPQNNNLNNLKWGTKSENAKDSLEQKTHPGFKNKGKNNPSAVLRLPKVNLIKLLYASKLFTQKEIGALFYVSNAQVSRIIAGKRWKHIWSTVNGKR